MAKNFLKMRGINLIVASATVVGTSATVIGLYVNKSPATHPTTNHVEWKADNGSSNLSISKSESVYLALNDNDGSDSKDDSDDNAAYSLPFSDRETVSRVTRITGNRESSNPSAKDLYLAVRSAEELVWYLNPLGTTSNGFTGTLVLGRKEELDVGKEFEVVVIEASSDDLKDLDKLKGEYISKRLPGRGVSPTVTLIRK